MNSLINNIYNKKFKYFLINKFNYSNTKKLPQPEKIILSFNCKNTDIKKIVPSLIALTLITKQIGCFIKSKKSHLSLKL
jgi:ribosomal protein L5